MVTVNPILETRRISGIPAFQFSFLPIYFFDQLAAMTDNDDKFYKMSFRLSDYSEYSTRES